MKLVDFHTHTTASDGIKSPRELIDFAIDMGVSVMAVTDHDTVSGLDEALSYSKEIDFEIIPGIEFSVERDKGSFHLVGLHIDHKNLELNEEVDKLKSIRDNRAFRIIENLKKYKININIEEVEKISGGGAIGRPHIARALIKNGYARTMKEVFSNFLVKGKPGYVRKEKISLERALELINNSGGISILAHPVSLEFKNLEYFEDELKTFVDKGLTGIEAYSYMHSEDEVIAFKALADKYGLIISGGSDYHGDKDEKIGYYCESEPIPCEIYERIKAKGVL